jgi:hypothetical protein
MPKTQIPIANGFYQSASLPISAQRCINWYPNIPQGDTVTNANLFGTAGIEQLVGGSPIKTTRGAIVSASIPYFVIGDELIKLVSSIDSGGVETFTTVSLGNISGSGRVSMADNGNQVCIVVPSGLSYIWDESDGALYTITDPAFDGPADSVVYIDGFFVFTTSTGKKFINSPLNDGRGAGNGTGVAYDALDFSVAEGDPDQIRAGHSFGGRLFILGSETTQVFVNIGRTPAPFQTYNKTLYTTGISAPNSIIDFGDTFAFVGAGVNESPSIYAFTGNGFKKISTTAIDNVLNELTAAELSSVYSWSYGKDGAFFIGFQLPNTCFVYESITGLWHERLSYSNKKDIPYRVAAIITAYGRTIVGDNLDGRIGAIQNDLYTEYDTIIRRIVTTKPFDNLGNRVFLSSIEAVMETGVGVSGGVPVAFGSGSSVDVGQDPMMMMEYSDDGSRSFGNGRFRSLGKAGEYNRRVIWRRVNSFPRSRVLRFVFSEPVKPVFIKLEVDIVG